MTGTDSVEFQLGGDLGPQVSVEFTYDYLPASKGVPGIAEPEELCVELTGLEVQGNILPWLEDGELLRIARRRAENAAARKMA